MNLVWNNRCTCKVDVSAAQKRTKVVNLKRKLLPLIDLFGTGRSIMCPQKAEWNPPHFFGLARFFFSLSRTSKMLVVFSQRIHGNRKTRFTKQRQCHWAGCVLRSKSELVVFSGAIWQDWVWESDKGPAGFCCLTHVHTSRSRQHTNRIKVLPRGLRLICLCYFHSAGNTPIKQFIATPH